MTSDVNRTGRSESINFEPKFESDYETQHTDSPFGSPTGSIQRGGQLSERGVEKLKNQIEALQWDRGTYKAAAKWILAFAVFAAAIALHWAYSTNVTQLDAGVMTKAWAITAGILGVSAGICAFKSSSLQKEANQILNDANIDQALKKQIKKEGEDLATGSEWKSHKQAFLSIFVAILCAALL